MKGYRVQPKGTKKHFSEIQSMISDYSKTVSPGKQRELKRKMRWFKKTHGSVTSRLMSGFKSFVIENTKVEV